MPDESIAKRTQRPLAQRWSSHTALTEEVAYGLRQPAARRLERALLPPAVGKFHGYFIGAA